MSNRNRKLARNKAKERWSAKNASLPTVGEGRGFDLTKLLLSDLDEITLDVTEELVSVSVNLPVGNNEAYAEYQEVLDLDQTPDYLRRAAKEFTDACARAVRERQLLRRDLPCATCTGACCRRSDIQLNASDVARLEAAGIDVTESIDYYDAESCGGQVGEFELIQASVHFGEDAPDEVLCPHLRPDGCSIYEHRPTICREYSAWSCEAYEEDPEKREGHVSLRVVP